MSQVGGDGVPEPRKSPTVDSLPNYGGSVDESEATDSTSEDTGSKSDSGGGIPYTSMREAENPVLGVPADTDSLQSQGSEGRNSLIAPTNFKARTLFYPTMDQSQSLETDVLEFISSLFWVLESKRLDKLA